MQRLRRYTTVRKKEKRALAEEKRARFLEEERQAGLKAQRLDHESKERQKRNTVQEVIKENDRLEAILMAAQLREGERRLERKSNGKKNSVRRSASSPQATLRRS